MPYQNRKCANPERMRDHPAVKALREVGLARDLPISIERLCTLKGKGSVYRLCGVGASLVSIIAKCGPRDRMLVERFAYQEMLPQIGLTRLECYGFFEDENKEDEDGECWLLLEDACGEKYSESRPSHVALASEWTARLHVKTAARHLGAHLPNHGKGYYLENLVEAGRIILEAREIRRFSAKNALLLETIASHCDALGSHWNEIWRFCDAFPKCLLHGDLINKNMMIRMLAGRPALYVMDWECASWSVPVEDIAGLDMAIYWPIVREIWPQLDLETAQRAAHMGSIMKYSAWIHGYSLGLLCDNEDIEDTFEDLRYCEDKLATARREAGW
jgi:hypothetical protein